MKEEYLKNINSPQDLRQLSQDNLSDVAKELRQFIIDIVSKYGGHLGASLGTVELTIALHYVFNTPDDQLIWDVGHQAYGHKILTGRRDKFHTNRQLGGISGFPSREESPYDAFGVGHSSTSISATLGMAIASKLEGNLKREHIAVIGDASIASGMAFEGLNHAGVTSANFLVILNDNAIGIDPSVGALKNYLTKAKIGYKPKQSNIIEALNFTYVESIDGHDISALIKAFNDLKQIKGPRFLHVMTKKGKGLKSAEIEQVKYHAPGRFDKITGKTFNIASEDNRIKYQDVFGKTLLYLAEQDEKIIGVTPAMPTGSSLKYMMAAFPKRAFDVGIAEQHAVTFSAGMATRGFKVFCTIYSTFLQRAYDQLIHDVALQNLPVVFCVDRAGIVGNDGATHHGVFDIGFLKGIPNLIIASPSCAEDIKNLLYTASLGLKNPIIIRYPRGKSDVEQLDMKFQTVSIGKAKSIKVGENIAILSLGKMRWLAEKAIKKSNKNIGLYDMRFVKPLDTDTLDEIAKDYKKIITLEDGVVIGGFGESIQAYLAIHHPDIEVKTMGLPDKFISHGNTDELFEKYGLGLDDILKVIEA
ncbi:1-deoxy-D-xylulose-5-phosphate synthase [Flavobacterium sp. CS20]|uniref:1-deoxy-D-xylulose-5-phosphate synthase n=1 Tax=Flavobacterium sp. CS20 TaxID=2775246 RepID=UPI001B3A1BC3|nr:1-deoxy-D-xylulose-5-phosphate synthase [Flavobacterium sp. CS20]QTY26033.1 1-deoxy-D-xylulose-5-phosphate synthase [Flavobacterium sp. CS20]